MSSKQSNFFSVRTETNQTQSVSVVFLAKQKNIFLDCFSVSDLYRNNRNKQNFVKTNRNKPKKSPKTFSIRGSSKQLIFFLGLNRNKPKLNLFRLFFRQTPKNLFGLFRCFRPVSKQQKQTELMVWGIKKVDILTNFLLFCLFQLFQNTETPCFDIKVKQPKQTSCFG